jgi:hypothetical protein
MTWRTGTSPGGSRALRWLVVPGLLVLTAAAVLCAPDLSRPRQAGKLKVFPDGARSGRYYYLPGALTLATSEGGRPDFHFLQIRHTGTTATGDRGVIAIRSILSFRVVMDGPAATDVSAAKRALRRGTQRIELRPMPIRRVEAGLIYAPLGPPEGTPPPATALPGGQLTADTDTGVSSDQGFWTERVFTLSLDEATSQAFWDAMHAGQVVVSLGYAFYSVGVAPQEPVASLTGPPELVEQLREQLEPPAATDAPAGAPSPTRPPADHLVAAGVTAVTVDAARWPELFQQLETDAAAPPGYPVLEVRCYDFRDAEGGDLYEKQVEVEGEGPAGGTPRLALYFSRSQPDLCAATVRFQVAVRLDRPFRYRVTEVLRDGTTRAGTWVQRDSWHQMLDVTTPAPAGAPLGGTGPDGEATDEGQP